MAVLLIVLLIAPAGDKILSDILFANSSIGTRPLLTSTAALAETLARAWLVIQFNKLAAAKLQFSLLAVKSLISLTLLLSPSAKLFILSIAPATSATKPVIVLRTPAIEPVI